MTDARSWVASLPRDLSADALTPGSRGYREAQHTYTYRGAPAVILRPADAGQVAEAVSWVRESGVPFAVRSGGHGISGRSTNDDGVVSARAGDVRVALSRNWFAAVRGGEADRAARRDDVPLPVG